MFPSSGFRCLPGKHCFRFNIFEKICAVKQLFRILFVAHTSTELANQKCSFTRNDKTFLADAIGHACKCDETVIPRTVRNACGNVPFALLTDTISDKCENTLRRDEICTIVSSILA